MLTNIDQGDLRGHRRQKDFFKKGDTKRFFQNFSRRCQKWQNLLFFTRNYENNFFCKNFQSPGGPRPSLPPFQRPCTWTQHG